MSTKLCLVFFPRRRRWDPDFLSLVPGRLAAILGDDLELHVLTCEHYERDPFAGVVAAVHRYGDGIFSLPVLRECSLAARTYTVAKRFGVRLFMNVWTHYALVPVVVGAHLAGGKVIARIAGVPIGAARPARRVRARIRRRLGLLLERVALKTADHIQVLCRSLRDTYVERGVPRDRITVLSQGVDTARFRPLGGEEQDRPPTLLYVGRLVRNKGLAELISALELVHEEIRDVRLVVVGEGEERASLMQACRNAGLEGQVEFVRYVANVDLPSIYHAADLLVLTSASEGLSNAILEAQASGLPVLATGVGGTPELLTEGRGFIAPRRADKLARTIVELLGDPSLRREASERARRFILREHSLDALNGGYRMLFSRVLGSDD